MQALVLLALVAGWIGIVVYSAESTRIRDCPAPSARSVESLFAPCLERQDYAAADTR